MAQDNGAHAGWLKAVATLGVPSVIALFTVYWLTTSATADQKETVSQMGKLSNAFTGMWSEFDRHRTETAESDADHLNMLRQQCLILARIARVNAEVACADRQRGFAPRVERERTSGREAGRMFDN